MMLKHVCMFLIIMLTLLASVQANLFPKEEFLAMDINSTAFINAVRPIDSGYDIVDGHYLAYLSYVELNDVNDEYIDVTYVSEGFTFYIDQLHWCYGHYSEAACDTFFYSYTEPVDLIYLGYSGTHTILEPLQYHRNNMWIRSYNDIVAFRDMLLTEQEDDYGNLFNEEEGGFV